MDPGSKGVNIARFITHWGGKAIVYGLAGGRVGSQIKSLLEKEGVRFDFVWTKGENRVITNVFESQGSRELRINEPGPIVTPEEIKVFLKRLFARIRSREFLVISGSLPAGAPVNIYSQIIHQAKRKNIKVLLDTDGPALAEGLKARPFLIKPNRFELSRLIGRTFRSLKDILNIAKSIQSRLAEAVIVSAGEKEAILACPEGLWTAQPPRIKKVSSVGAGDAMLAGIAFCLSNNQGWEQAFRFGVAAGSAKAGREGTKPCSLSQVKRLLGQVQLRRI